MPLALVKVAVLPVGRKSMLPVPPPVGVQLIVAVGAVTVIVEVPLPTPVCVALVLDATVPLNACARACCGAIVAAAAIAIDAQESISARRLPAIRFEPW